MPRRAISLVLLLLLPALADAAPTRYAGEAVVRTLDEKRVAVFLDTDGDEKVDQGFLLSADLPIGKLAVRLNGASIEFTDNYVRVAADQKLYDLQVAGYPEPPTPPEDSQVMTLIGYALVHSSGDSGCDLERALSRDADACFAYGAN